MRKKIAILGAGFAGLATAWHLIYRTRASVMIDIFDPLPIGGGTSGLSSGLLHPYTGKHARPLPDENTKLEYAHNLITEASQGYGGRVVLSHGILRPATNPQQIEEFKLCAHHHPEDTQWWPQEQCIEKIPGLKLQENESGGLYIKSGLTLDVKAYLEGLFQTVAKLGTTHHRVALQPNDKRLAPYDVIIYATGSATKHLLHLLDLPLIAVKGQLLYLRWPDGLPPLPMSLISEGYLVMTKDLKGAIAGSTFETSFSHHFPDLEFAQHEIRRKILPFFPEIEKMGVLDCWAGVRATSKRKLPIVGKVSKKEWCITGFGSKGLLYHGWLGYVLAKAILKDDPSIIPQEFSP